LRIAPEVPRATKLLSGGSAGAIFVCAMFAASRREELNSDATTSIALVNPGTADSVDGLNSIQIKPVAADSMQAKLDEAQRRGLKRVVLHPEQTGYKAPLGLQVGNKVSDLADVYDQLTGNARMERVLARYSDAVAEAWHQLWTTENDERLLYYVPPKYRLLRPNASKKGLELMVALTEHATRSETTPEEPYEDIALDSEEQTLTALLKKAGPKLCISEGPGAGKSIFTRRLAAFLSGQAGRDALANGKPFLAVRWEEWGLDARWPQDFEQSLADAVRSARDAEGIAESAEEVVAWALEHGRVVFILDALDQTADDRVECFRDFLAQLHTRKCICRIVLTGRPFAVETLRAPLLAHGGWRFGAILPFDFQQQYRYLLGPESVPGATDAWQARDLAGVSIRRLVNPVEGKDQDELIDSLRNLFPFYGDVQELLGNPNTLWMVRRLAEEGHALNFRNRTELYLQTSRFMLDYAARKLREWPTEKGQAAAWGEHEITRGDRERWEELLAAAAFEMMSRHAEHFRVSGQLDVDLLRRGAGQRCSTPPDDAEWRLVERIAQLTNRTLLYASSQLVWAWPNRRMMEFYCGLHLARNSQSGWVQDEVGQPLRCGDETLRQHAGDPQWKEPFLYALEMPASVRNDAVLRASLAELFQPDAGLHTDNRRPTELMFHAYGALTSVPRHLRELQLPDRVIVGGERVLQEYHRQFRLLVEQRNPIALELVLDHEITAEEGQQNRWPSLVACPPGERPPETECTFNMGAREFEARDSDDVRPVHPVRLTPFWLQTTSVTRQQFGLFDPHYEKAEQVTLTKYAPKLTCPAIEVSYYDAYLFALFIGGRLPTEAEWEYACRARTDTPYSFGYQLNGDKANVDGNHPYGTEDIGRYLEQTSEVGSYACNDFGLYDMHGNVWEWCADWHDDDYYQSCIDKNGTAATPDPQGPEEGVFRSLRGGSWYNNARRARSAYRSGEEPDLRCSDFGFRVMLLRTVFAA
jgi:formylglycine-generating enzyme required for sulfatase activity